MKKYEKPFIKEEGEMKFPLNILEEASQIIMKEYKEHGTVNGKKVPKRSDISCRQCSACHGCR